MQGRNFMAGKSHNIMKSAGSAKAGSAKTGADIVLNVILAVVIAAVVLFSLILVYEINDYATDYRSDEEQLTNTLSYSADRFLYLTERNEALGVEESGDMAELAALAHFYDNAVRARAFENVGNTEAADRYNAAKEEELKKCGSYAFMADELEKSLGIK